MIIDTIHKLTLGNGKAERYVKRMKNNLLSIITQNEKNESINEDDLDEDSDIDIKKLDWGDTWDEDSFTIALMCCRIMPSKSLKMSPCEALIGRPAVFSQLQIDSMSDPDDIDIPEPTRAEQTKQKKERTSFINEYREQLKKAKEYQKKQFDKNTVKHRYHAGDPVLYKPTNGKVWLPKTGSSPQCYYVHGVSRWGTVHLANKQGKRVKEKHRISLENIKPYTVKSAPMYTGELEYNEYEIY